MTNWEKYTIGDLCEVGRGSSPRPIIDQRYFKGGTIPWIKIADAIASGKYIYETNEHVNEIGASFSRYLDKGSLIIAASGVSLGQIKFLGVKGCIHDGWLYTSNFKDELINKEFLYYFLIYYSEGFHNFSSGAAIQNINTDILRKTIIALPPISVQEIIVSIISAYDDLIEVNNQRIKLLEETARELYKEWFVRMRFPGYKKAKFMKGMPEGWEVKKVKDIVDRRKFGKTYKPEELSEHGNVIVIDQSTDALLGFHNNNPDHLATSESPMIIFGDHTCKMQLMIEPFSLAENVIPIAAKDKIPIYYLYYLIESLVETTEYKRHWNDLVTKSVFVCQPELQIKYAGIVKPFFEQIEILKQQNTQLRQIRDRLLPRLISGKLEVKEKLKK